MSSQGKRSTRVAEAVREEITMLLMRGAVKDPGARGVVVSAVRVTDDLGIARIYVRLLDTNVSDRKRERALSALERASGFMRREVSRQLHLRRAPELEFHWDDSVDEALRIERLLGEIRSEESWGDESGGAANGEKDSTEEE